MNALWMVAGTFLAQPLDGGTVSGPCADQPAGVQAPTGIDPAGYPLREIAVSLTPGRVWELRTDAALTPVAGAPFADSVLSVAAADGTAVAAADGCAGEKGFAWEPSCLTVTVPAGAAPVHKLHLRAARAWTAGQTTLWKRDVTDPRAPGPLEAITTGPITFGGAVASVHVAAGGATFDTWRRPGKNLHHAVWTLAADGIAVESVDDGDPMLFDTVRALLDCGPKILAYGGTSSDEVDPIGFVQLGLDESDDWDGDGLDLAQEQAQGICDRPLQGALTSGFRCDTRTGCGGADEYVEALCRASLRDTDHDGLGDHAELRGVAGDYPAGFPSLDLPAMGVSPAHMDLLIEVDARDQDRSTAMWDGFVAGTIQGIGNTSAFFADVQQAYGRGPARLNPDGRPGIALHWDVGVANTDPATRTVWNDWGGGNTPVIASCNRDDAWANVTHVERDDGSVELRCYWPDMFVDERKGVFFYSVDSVNDGGQASTGVGVYDADTTDIHVHELAHLAYLAHEGPRGSAAGSGPAGNTRVNYLSRINYLFQSVFVGTTRWQDVAFSDGSGPPRATAALPELAVLPDAIALALPGGARTQPSSTRPGWRDVDWNGDGTFGGSGSSAPMASERMTRNYVLRGRQPTRVVPELARVGRGALVMAHGVDAAGGDNLVLRVDRDGDCDVLPRRWSASDRPDEYGARGPYPGCFRPGGEQTVVTAAMGQAAVADAVVVAAPFAGSEVGTEAIVMWRNAGLMRWGTYRPDATERFSYGGVLSQFAVAPGWDRPFDVIGVPGTDALRFVYIDSAYQLVQSTRSGGSWGALAYPVTSWGPTPVAVDLANLGGVTYAVVADVAGELRVFRVPVDDRSPWVEVGKSGAQSMMPWDGVSLAAARTRSRSDSGPSRLVVNFRNAGQMTWQGWEPGGRLVGMEFQPPSTNQVTSVRNQITGRTTTLTPTGTFDPLFFVMENNNELRGYGVADTLWDDRPSLAPELHGLRMLNPVGQIDSEDCEAGTVHRGVGTRFHCLDSETDAPYTSLAFYPFADGVDPTIFADYDDWTGMQWGFCHALAVKGPAERCRCGPTPSYPEPVVDGGGGVTLDASFHSREWVDGCTVDSL